LAYENPEFSKIKIVYDLDVFFIKIDRIPQF